MATEVFQVRVRKQHDTKLIKWENRYYVLASDLLSAHTAAGNSLVTMEAGIHNAGITIIELITSDLPEGGDFIAENLTVPCTNGISGDELPGILTLNCTFQKTGFGRPDRKYYHGFYGEVGQAAGLWVPTVTDGAAGVIADGIGGMSTDGAPLCSREGNVWLGVTVLEEVGHHKFSKRSRRAVASP